MTEQEKREKVIKGLEHCVNGLGECEVCPYDEGRGKLACGKNLYFDVLALLKAQEPVKPKVIDTANSKLYHNDMFKNYYCGNCGEFLHVITRMDMFCSQCGRKVKWE